MLFDRRNFVVVLAVILLGGMAFFAWWNRPQIPASPSAMLPATSSSSKIAYASDGELAAGFPGELILDEKAKLQNSFSVNYDQNLNQYAATYSSDMSMTELFNLYKSYFPKNGWTITNQITKYQGSRGLYAVKGATEVGVAVMAQSKTSQVVVSYVVK